MPDEGDVVELSACPSIAKDASVALGRCEVESTDVVLDPPTQELAAYDPFVRWLLSSTLEELSAVSQDIPFVPGVSDDDDDNSSIDSAAVHYDSITVSKASAPARFDCVWSAKLARAEVEGELEAVADCISVAWRECSGVDEALMEIDDERDVSRERIALLEARIGKHLQDRDLAIAEKYTTEKHIEEAERFKLQHPQRQNSMSLLPGFLRRSSNGMNTSSGNASFSAKDVERLQKEVADTKVAAALAKCELDTHYYRLRQLERKCASVKFEIAQASALEDDLRASIEQLARGRKNSLERLHQISLFSAEASASVR